MEWLAGNALGLFTTVGALFWFWVKQRDLVNEKLAKHEMEATKKYADFDLQFNNIKNELSKQVEKSAENRELILGFKKDLLESVERILKTSEEKTIIAMESFESKLLAKLDNTLLRNKLESKD